MPDVEVIIPTFKNAYWLKRCIQSLADAKMPEITVVHIVDNGGDFYESDYFVPGLTLRVYKPGKNLGWTSALAHALPHVTAPYVVFLNDDTEFERMSDRLALMLQHFVDPKVGMVGPATSIALGKQSVEGPDIEQVKLLIGFCQLIRVDALKAAGGLDESYNMGGDDFDLCIRLADAGYKLILDRRVFVYHHAFKTGQRLFGKANVPGGWNSPEMATAVYDRISGQYGKDRLLDLIRAPEFTPKDTPIGNH